MAIGLTNLDIKPVAGSAALLPNQPIIQGCKVSADFEGVLVPGDIVKLVEGEAITVTKATQTDLPCGVVVNCEVKTGYKANDIVSIFPFGSFVYLASESTDITSGSNVGIDDEGAIDVVTTDGAGIVGIAWTKPQNNIFIAQVYPKINISLDTLGGFATDIEQLKATKQNNLNLGAGLEFVETDMYAWEGELAGVPIVYTLTSTPSASGNTVYYLNNGIYDILVDDATYADSKLSFTVDDDDYDYTRSSDNDRQDNFLDVKAE